jgi:hypothetical protein
VRGRGIDAAGGRNGGMRRGGREGSWARRVFGSFFGVRGGRVNTAGRRDRGMRRRRSWARRRVFGNFFGVRRRRRGRSARRRIDNAWAVAIA